MKTILRLTKLFFVALLFLQFVSINVNAQECEGAEPVLTQYMHKHKSWVNGIEITNPGTTDIDLSDYMLLYMHSGMDADNTIDSVIEAYESRPFDHRHSKYIPGYEWVDETTWETKPGYVTPDLSGTVDPVIGPGESFFIASNGPKSLTANMILLFQADVVYDNSGDVILADHLSSGGFTGKVIDVPGVISPTYQYFMGFWGKTMNKPIFLLKILNPDIKAGLKGTFDPADFELIDMIGDFAGTNWLYDGSTESNNRALYTRKSHILNGNPEPNGSFGSSAEESEWEFMIASTNPEDNAIRDDAGVHAFTFLRSCEYVVDQTTMVINDVPSSETVTDLLADLVAAPGASLSVVDTEDDEVTTGAVSDTHKVKVFNGTDSSYYSITLGIATQNEKAQGLEAVQMYPNPTSGSLRFNGLRENSVIEVLDITGRSIKTIQMGSLRNGSISIEDQPSGMYFITLKDNAAIYSSFKVLKK